MKSQKHGKNTLKPKAQVTQISQFGIWILANDCEYYLPFKKFPWFLKANIGQIQNLKLSKGYHLQWPDLDIDLDLDSINFPEKYPLVYL